MNKMLWAFVVCFLSIGKIYSASDIEPIKTGYTQKPVASLAELEEAIPATDVQRIIMGYLDSWENPIKVTKKHKKGIFGLVYSAQGNYIASSSEDGCVKLWYAQRNRWQARKTLKGHQDEVTALAISHDGKKLASAGSDGFIRIIALKNNKCNVTQIIQAHKSNISSLVFSPDSNYIVSGSLDKTIKIWHYQNNKYELAQTLEEQQHVSAVNFFSQGKNIISGDWGGAVKIWQYNQENKRFEYKQDLPNNACAVNPLATPLVTKGAAEIVDGKNELINNLQNSRKRVSVFNITSSFDETKLAISSGTGLIELWCYQDDQWICTQKIEHDAILTMPLVFSSDNNYLVAVENRNIKIYKLNQYKQFECIQIISALKNDVTALLFSPDTISLIYGLLDGSIKIIKNQALELYAHAKAEKPPK
jgi:WD40 repeat protein